MVSWHEASDPTFPSMGGSTGGHCPPPTLETHFGECPLGLWALFCITRPIVVSQIRCSLPYSDRLKALRSSSKMTFVHDLWLSIQRDMYPGEQPKELQKLSDTRWACRYAACKTLRDRLPAIIRLLNELESGVKGSRALDARSLLLNIDARFVAMLTLMTDLLERTHTISKISQSTRLLT